MIQNLNDIRKIEEDFAEHIKFEEQRKYLSSTLKYVEFQRLESVAASRWRRTSSRYTFRKSSRENA